jgi:hypothetical protein
MSNPNHNRIGVSIWDKGIGVIHMGIYMPMVIALYKHSHITNIDIIRWLSSGRGGGTLSLRVLRTTRQGVRIFPKVL